MMNKETIKEFLKPDWRKVAMFVILAFFILVFLGIPIKIYDWSGLKGLEFVSILKIGEIMPFLNTIDVRVWIIWHLLFIELIIFYPLSCLIISVYDKFKTKK